MGESNKVLSVSYGTFSCRLEGFDDSVETMKAVVSYFHELAGHDRFMDMDPQAPDVDALAELTQEEDAAPVEVTTVAGAVSLRMPKPDVDQDEAQGITNLRQALATPAPEDFAEAHDDTASEDDLAANEDVAVDEIIEDDADNDLIVAENDAEPEMEEDAPHELTADEGDDAPVDEVTEEAFAEAAEADFASEEVAADEADDTADAEPLIAEEDDDAEVEAVESPEPVEDAPSQDETPFYDPASARDASEDSDSVTAKLERIRALVGRVPPANRGAPPAQPETAAPTGSVTDRLSALAGKSDAAEPRSEDIVDGFDFKNEDAAPLVLSGGDASDEDDDTVADHDPEIAAEDDSDATADVENDDDIVAEDAADEADEEEDELAMRRLNQSKRANLPKNDDDAMSRIMSQADQRLSEPEGRRHRDAFAQLKAAVAATEAARQLGDREEDADPQDAFREDLDEAVREDDDSAEQPVGSPLKLVAEQRIEDEPANPADRLRQIASVKEGDDAPSAGFAEFAEEQGATELGDLLEAAAAYIAFVEGDDDFSRPQVMKKVQLASSDTFSREDGLRSFGRLLRQSRIIKLNNGRFQVSEDTRFRPADKAAQG